MFTEESAILGLVSRRGDGRLRKQQKNSRLPVAIRAVSSVRRRFYESRRKAATVAAGALAILVGYGVIFGHNGLTVFAHKREEARELQQQMQQLQGENARLRGHVDELQNDPAAIEHQAREELHYTRAGEVIYTLPAPPGRGSAAPEAH
jgi:cell division protein FtsB